MLVLMVLICRMMDLTLLFEAIGVCASLIFGHLYPMNNHLGFNYTDIP